MNLSYEKEGEPVGAVYFKKNSAQRCFSGRNLWERLKVESPVYKGDRIRTNENSQAFIVFSDAERIDLDENTLIRIPDDTEKAIEFISGTLILTSTKNADDKPIVIKSGTKIITLEKNTSIVLNYESSENDSGYITPVLYVKSGEASIRDENNKASVEKIQAGNITKFRTKIEPQKKTNPYIPQSLTDALDDANKLISENDFVENVKTVIKDKFTGEETDIFGQREEEKKNEQEKQNQKVQINQEKFDVLMPPVNYKILSGKGHKEKIPFYWTGTNKIRIEFAYDKDFKTVVDTERISSSDRKGTVTLDFIQADDVLYWRAFDDTVKSGTSSYPRGKINVNAIIDEQIKESAKSVFGDKKADVIAGEVQKSEENIKKEEEKTLKNSSESVSTKTLFVQTDQTVDFTEAVKQIRKESEKKKQEEAKIQKQKEDAELKAQKEKEKKRLAEKKKKKQLAEQKKKEAEKKRLAEEKKKQEAEKKRLEAEKKKKESMTQPETIEHNPDEVNQTEQTDAVEETQEVQEVQPEKEINPPELLLPENDMVYTTQVFKAQEKPQIEFSWSKVPEAEFYILEIKNEKDETLFAKETRETGYIFADELSMLADGGTFTWTVSVSYKNGKERINKKASPKTFKIDLGKLSPVVIDSSNLITE